MATTRTKNQIERFSKITTDPLRNFRFLANFTVASGSGDVPGVFSERILQFSGGFTRISGFSINTQSIPYREGGMNTTIHQVPGQTSFMPITLERGTLYNNDEAITWMKGLFAAASGDGIPNADGKNFRCNIEIFVLDHPITAAPLIDGGDVLSPKSYKMKFLVHNAWIAGLSYSDLVASDNNILFETMTLVHEGLSVSFVQR